MKNRKTLIGAALFSFAITGLCVFGINDIAKALRVNQKYDAAIQIQEEVKNLSDEIPVDTENAFAFGTLKAVDPISCDNLDGKYACIRKVTERYTSHLEPVRTTGISSKGEMTTYMTTIEHNKWEEVKTEDFMASTFSFMGEKIKSKKLALQGIEYLTEEYKTESLRYVYQGLPAENQGTMYMTFKNGKIVDAFFMPGKSIEEAKRELKQTGRIVFQAFGTVFLIICVIASMTVAVKTYFGFDGGEEYE